jgi:thioredoxin reductase (NADPH)
VVVVHRRDQLRASKIMQKRAVENPKISFLWNTVITGYQGKDALQAVMLRDTVTGKEWTREVGGVFMGIGHRPSTEFLRGAVELDNQGYIATRNGVETSIEGVFAAGDVHDRYFRQAITAAGFGCMAALKAERWLEMHPLKS